MLINEFDYHLPSELIAQEPIEPRDASKLLVVNRKDGSLYDACFYEIENWFYPGDLLVLNNTKVIPARIFGKLTNESRIELLLLRHIGAGEWEVLIRPAKKAKPNTGVYFKGYKALILETRPDGIRIVRFSPEDVKQLLIESGELAIPPYIRKKPNNPERYQTVYAERDGAVAAPTAGLHFTPELINRLSQKGVQFAYITLHASLGTFRPIKVDRVECHKMHAEEFELPEDVADKINQAIREKRRVIVVGTTTVRVLESQAEKTISGVTVKPQSGETDLYIYPGYEWKVVNGLITNFHLPKSTLLLLVCAFGGKELIMKAYQHAIVNRYRFYSFGDAMLII